MSSFLRSKLSVFARRRLQADRRGGKRLAPNHRTICRLQTPGEDAHTTAVVQNLSLRGVGMRVDREYTPGTLLHVLLVNDSHTFSVALELSVARCFRVANDQFYLAGPFGRPLTHEEVVPFIR